MRLARGHLLTRNEPAPPRFHERLAQVTLRPRPTAPRDWRAAFAAAAFRQRACGLALMLVSVVCVSIGLLVGDLVYAPIVSGGMGVYGLYLWRS